MLAVLIHCLEHLVEGHADLKHKYKKTQRVFSSRLHVSWHLWPNRVRLYLQHASRPLLLKTLQKGPHKVIYVQQLELCLNDGLQRL